MGRPFGNQGSPDANVFRVDERIALSARATPASRPDGKVFLPAAWRGVINGVVACRSVHAPAPGRGSPIVRLQARGHVAGDPAAFVGRVQATWFCSTVRVAFPATGKVNLSLTAHTHRWDEIGSHDALPTTLSPGEVFDFAKGPIREYSFAARPREETRILDGYRGLSLSYVPNITTLSTDIILRRTPRATLRRVSIVAGSPQRAFPVWPPNLMALTSANGIHLHTLDYCIVPQDTRLKPQALQYGPLRTWAETLLRIPRDDL
ncbi:hypothetical protein PHLGIDRAFT_114282 [Phlebiopsis gigantea 11061_1 CR5-6]|uniref:Uncharacterized protein n=1 Tax=Phlebiopsis gigantea (strain 11061_1 CR5-6) TaxID=745531 RepID=A0A0C3S682_PHLG1|nr:hypothetical protein PHLGIDRAFT_114282 [Phlebiopsis gigantea 11061_1 CR5-6]